MKTALENQREAQEAATKARDAFKKKMNRLAMIPLVLAFLFLAAYYFFGRQ